MTVPPFSVFPELKSERIRMRRLVHGDLPEIMEVCYFNGIPARDAKDAAEIIDKIEARYQDGSSIHWVIENVSAGQIVGTCGYYRGFNNDCGEVGYIMKEKYRRTGYMTEAVRLAVDFGFNIMKLKKVFATTAQENLASQSVLRKNGFIAAGIEENGHLRFHVLR